MITGCPKLPILVSLDTLTRSRPGCTQSMLWDILGIWLQNIYTEVEISTMTDIYSLGMLILEITTGEKNCPDAEDRSARRYVENVHKHWTTNEIIKCNYPLLDSDDLQQVKACIVIGLNCVEPDQNKRPSIVDIVNKLNGERVPIFDQLSFMFERKIKMADEEAVNELMKILTDGNEVSMEQGKIVSIVGLGGLGKTTLAHAIYQKLRGQFNCYAFVSVSQNPDMKKLFKCMLYQLGKKSNANIHESVLDERLLVYELIEFLQKRRYGRSTNQCIPTENVFSHMFWHAPLHNISP
uniref:NB-ARC domain-containing protein n=1 Tax=Setaria italica TaxID=4555 RepID=K3ZJF1_SETIT